jgi:hypothetical protein
MSYSFLEMLLSTQRNTKMNISSILTFKGMFASPLFTI